MFTGSEGHPRRKINAVITPVFADLQQAVAPSYKPTGGSSERRLCEQVALNQLQMVLPGPT